MHFERFVLLGTHAWLDVCEVKATVSTVQIKLHSLYLLNVIIQRDDSQGGGEVGADGDSRTHRGGLAHIALIGGKLEIRSLVVLIQDLNNEVGVGWERMAVVLFGLREGKKKKSHHWCVRTP